MNRDETMGSTEWLTGELAALVASLSGRASGVWLARGDRLEQLAFVAGEGLDPDTVRAFAEATREVALSHGDLGIVRAYHDGRPAVVRASESPADSGSGRWLRAFGAARSVAVPLKRRAGQIAALLAVALGDAPADEEVVSRLRQVGSTLLDRLPLAP
jgi:hypothetical protein